VKRTLVVLTAFSLLFTGPMAFAGDRHHRGWVSHHAGHHYYPSYPSHRWHGNYYYRQRHHHNHDDDDAAYLVGGLLIGGLLTHAYHRSASQTYYAPSSVVVRETTTYAPAPATGRHLLRDLEGRCYEREVDSAGNEVRTELPREACNW